MTDLYGPLVYHWCRESGMTAEDAADLVQDVFQILILRLPRFRHDRPGDSFRGWLRTIVRNRIRDHARVASHRESASGGTVAHLQMMGVPEIEKNDDSGIGYSSLLRRVMNLIQIDFQPQTWQAFWKSTVEDLAPIDVAEQLGISVDSVYQARSRVLSRIREELGDN